MNKLNDCLEALKNVYINMVNEAISKNENNEEENSNKNLFNDKNLLPNDENKEK